MDEVETYRPRIPADLRRALQDFAEEDERTLTQYIIGVLEDHVAQMRHEAAAMAKQEA